MTLSRDELLELLRLVDATAGTEIDCEEFLARVAGYLERVRARHTASIGDADVVRHLRVCPECLEEFEALLEAYRDDD